MPETLLSLFAEQVERSPRRTALRFRSGGIWRSRTWSDWRDTAEAIAAALCAWGVAPGDRVAILSHTRIRWVESDLGVLLAGAATVPIYPTLRADTVGEILRDSGARVLIAEDPVQLAKVFGPEAGALPELERAVVFERASRLDQPDEAGRLDVIVEDVVPTGRSFSVHTFEEALAVGADRRTAEPGELSARAAGVTPETLAAVYYTSGTSGEPKGVMLTHDNFVFETQALREAIPVGVTDEQLLFLPLAHIMAKLTVMMQLRAGYVTSFATSIEQAMDDCAEVRPTFVVGVPRVFEKLEEAILRIPTQHGDVQRRVFDWALGVGRRVSELAQRGREPGALLVVQRRSAERLVFSRIKQRLGGRVRFMMSGGAPLARSTAELLHSLDLLVLEGYGLTESTGASTMNLPRRYRFGSVGRPLHGVSVRIAEADSEILLKGRSVAKGYWNEDDGEVFGADGWLHTGDVGSLDRDGFLEITDRKKDLIITAGGKNVAPQRIEQRLTRSPYVDRAVVLGDRRKFPVALLVPDRDALGRWARDERLDASDADALAWHPKTRALLAAEVARVNERLASFEQVKRFEVMTGDVADLLTPTGKLMRHRIAERYADLVDQLYEGVTTELEDLS